MSYVLITGSRDWTDFSAIEKQLKSLDKDSILVHGGAKGADKIAGYIWEKQMGGKVIACPAEWEKHGRAAGPIRNESMLKDYPIASALAFCKDNSKGTKHMISLLEKAGIPVVKIESISDDDSKK